jgi:hypothetical protein
VDHGTQRIMASNTPKKGPRFARRGFIVVVGQASL